MVTCKQRAPLFDEDQTNGTLMAEVTLREAMFYARTAHLDDATAERGELPVLYMNGWDVFEAIPSLWDPSIDQLPGTIDPITSRAYAQLHKRFGLGTEHLEK